MISWEQHLVSKIIPEVAPLWAIGDADGLFRNDEVARILAASGVGIVPFDDPVAFRFLYESEMRPRIEAGEKVCFALLIEPGLDGFRQLPADVYAAARQLEVALGDLFPKLSRRVLRELEPAILSRLWEKREALPAHPLGERDTADVVLRHAYRIEPALIENPSDLIRALLEIHFTGRRLPESLALRLEEIAGRSYSSSSLREIIRSSDRFRDFLQKEWLAWLGGGDLKVNDLAPVGVPFEDNQIRVYVDNLFLEGFLVPVALPAGRERLPSPWCKVGVIEEERDSTADLIERRRRLAESIPESGATYDEWLHFAGRYSSHVAAWFSDDRPPQESELFWRDLWEPIDARFCAWLSARLDTLHNLPPTRPVVAHQIPRFLARRVHRGGKVALLVLDGLSHIQWKVVREEQSPAMPEIAIREEHLFTLLPSITNVCRQALYAGELPVLFDSAIGRTDMDSKRWRAFWDTATGASTRVAHGLVTGYDSDEETVTGLLAADPKAVALTVLMADDTMHGATMGWRGMNEQLRIWARQSFLQDTISRLLAADFDVFLTADHGNIEAIGCGGFSEGVLADRRGQRVRVYSDRILRQNAAAALSKRTVVWDSKTLPPAFLPLLHTGRGAFAPEGQLMVCHGGASLDEMIIPFVEFSRAKSV